MTNMLDHVTWSRGQTRYKTPVLNHGFDELAPVHLLNNPRRKIFTVSPLLNFWQNILAFSIKRVIFSYLKLASPRKTKFRNFFACKTVLAGNQFYPGLIQTIYQIVSQTFFASCRSFSRRTPNCVWAEFQLNLIDIILRHFQIVSQPKFSCTSWILF